MVRMLLTLRRAQAARLSTCLDQRTRESRLELRLPAEAATGRRADVAAVRAQADTAHHHPDVALPKAPVGAGRARLRAVETGLDTAHERVPFDRSATWMRLQHLPSVTHDILLLSFP